MRELRTEITIAAPVSRVWEVLMDTESYPKWNPFVFRLEGNCEPGERIEVELSSGKDKSMVIRPRVQRCEKEKIFHWQGKLWWGGFFDGDHIFELEALSESETRLVHREEFRGILIPFLKKMIDVDTRAGFEAMNKALKKQAETVSGSEE